MHVVATAGHVDHGKSTLVRALTGREPDRLDEEQRRGLSIELGYAWTSLPGAGEVAFVDVPGHQRFVTTALAGMGPVPVTMFVVAADDPWMPQADEHLAALDALGVDRGVLVVTRADLTDPEKALLGARERLAATSLAGIPDVAVSGRTGEGLDRLRQVLDEVLADVPAPDPEDDVRLWVDRRFHIRGTGTVVTGTLPAGTIRVGDRLQADGAQVQVRGLEALERRRDEVSGVARVALALGGRAPTSITRGTALVTPNSVTSSAVVDVELRGSERPPRQPVLHVGSASQQVRLRLLAGRTARLRLDPALPLRAGDRAVLRDPGNREFWGVVVLDPAPVPPARRRVGRPEVIREPDEPEIDLSALAGHFDENPFAAPTADELVTLGLDDATAARLHRTGRLLRVAPGIVLLPGTDDRALDVLASLEQPFTTSAARQALATSRRVVLPLLAHLDKTGRTVRLADDRRRLRG